MALNIHTDKTFEKMLNWLSKRSHKTKTDVIKELVQERYELKRFGFERGALKLSSAASSEEIQEELKELDQDHDLA